MDNLQKYTLITGAGGLLGKYHAEALLETGENILLTDINYKSLIDLRNELKKSFKNLSIIIEKLDITSESSIIKLIQKIKKKNLIVKTLINNAAIDFKFKNKKDFNSKIRLENYDLNNWTNEINVGLTGPMLCSKHFGNQMVLHKIRGLIINIGSDLSIIAPNQSIYKQKSFKENSQPVKPVTYSVIKHGIVGLTKYLSTYWAEKGVRCNCLSPGPIDQGQNKNFLSKVKKQIPILKLAKPDDFKEAIKFLCSEKSSYMNGHNLVIDGGKSVW